MTAQKPFSDPTFLSLGIPENFNPKIAVHEKGEELPQEWEEHLFKILMDQGQSMDVRNGRLLEMATKTAVAVPSVQRECLRHLAFGLPDDDRSTFFNIIKNPSIPETLRAEFFAEVLNMRPSFLSGWLSEEFQDHTEWPIRNLAREYLTDLQENK